MVLQYQFGGKQHTIIANWTDENGQSCVYQDIVRKLRARHGQVFTPFFAVAREVDGAVDKLYEQIYIYSDECQALPYNPKSRKRFVLAFSEICQVLSAGIRVDRSKEDKVLAELFLSILDKLQEITGLYLLDTAYRGKARYRRKNFEEWAETTDERRMAYEFEDVLLQMNEVSNALDRLTAKERGRLVKHLFLKYTFQEIADHEGVRKQSVEESVSTALKKIRSYLGQS